MHRREMLKLCLSFPATVSIVEQEKKDQNNGTVLTLSNKTKLWLELADSNAESAGVTGLTVVYKGMKLEFSAREIWEALKD